MEVKIAALAGTLQGNTFLLSEDETSIGREESNTLCLPDSSASRRHCVIKKKQDVYTITDLESLNGTRVNNIPIRERRLEHEDRIEIGDSVFIFLKTKAVKDDVSSHAKESPVLAARPTVRLRPEDAIYLQPEIMLRTHPLTLRIAQGLDALIKITAAVQSIRSPQKLATKLLELIFDVVPAERGAILWRNNNEGWDLVSSLCRSSTDSFEVSKTIIDQVLTEGTAFLSNEIQKGSLNLVDSLRVSQIQSLLAVPLILREEISGLLYLDTTDSSIRFDEDHLHLITSVASIAGLGLENTKQFEWLVRETQQLREEIKIQHNMIGESQSMLKVYRFIEKVASADSTILIRGESGTGKELVGHAIHLNSNRALYPFVIVNCATLTETLLESELFGYEKGAFTGAESQKKGKLEVANKGTVFLDEVGELPLNLQSKLLRVLQNHQFDRVGGTSPVTVDIRFVAATNRNLEESIRLGNFRQDLFFRLNVINLTIPPLRERVEDIPLLTNYFLTHYSKKSKKKVRGISAEARSCMMSYDWPGNVRELENAIERSVVMSNTETILLEDLPENIMSSLPDVGEQITNYHKAVAEARKKIVLQALQQAEGSHKKAADILGIHPNNFGRLVRQFNLKFGK